MKNYFPHDLNARNDEKITNLLMANGFEGYGIYWCIIEMLYENNGWIDNSYVRIAFELRTNKEIIKSVVEDFFLFIFSKDKKKFSSPRVLSQLEFYKTKSTQAQKAVNLRWKKHYTKVIRTYTVSNTDSIQIKENKIKENKINIAKKNFALETVPNLLEDKQKHIQIIGLYARAKKVNFENKEQVASFIKRNLKASIDLKAYDIVKIVDVMKYLIENADYKWTLETVGKHIDEDLTKITNKKQEKGGWDEDIMEKINKNLINKGLI